MKTTLFRLAFGVAVVCAFATVQAQPVITYSISGSSGDYTLDFTVNNQTPGTQGQDIYFWGVYDPMAPSPAALLLREIITKSLGRPIPKVVTVHPHL